MDNRDTDTISRPKGQWIKHIDDLFPAESTLECNLCHHEQPITIDDEFCPHCGADMQAEARSKTEEAWNRRAEPSRPHGYWKIIFKGTIAEGLACSECGKRGYGENLTNFCPNCGADMRQNWGAV